MIIGVIYYKAPTAIAREALDRINTRCGFPDQKAEKWDDLIEPAGETFAVFQKPPACGYNGFTQEYMLEGIDAFNLEEVSFNPDWI